MSEAKLLERITYNPQIFGGKPILRGRRLLKEILRPLLGPVHASDLGSRHESEAAQRRQQYLAAENEKIHHGFAGPHAVKVMAERVSSHARLQEGFTQQRLEELQ